ncbi:MAG: outer membrane beta-barrel protein [Rhodomicrobium sp.]
MFRRIVLASVSAIALTAAANAADMYVPGAAPAGPGGYKDSVYIYNWSGFYLGADVGGAWGHVDLKDTTGGVPPGPFSFSADGVLGGGTLGYNLQRGHFVFGIEGDMGYMNLSGSTIVASSNPAYHQNVTLDGGAYGDVTGRLGYAFDRTLLYAKGGFAFYSGEGEQVTTKPGYTSTGTGTFTGWTAGGGIEHFISPAWSVKAEYMHFDFGTKGGAQTSVSDPPIGYVYKNTFAVTADSAKAGINYHFGAIYEPLK